MSMIKITTDNFKENVLEGAKPALVEFSAPWCTYCRRIGPAMKKIAEQYADKMLIGEINIDEKEEMEEEYKVEVIHTMMVFKDGKMLGSITAPDSKAKIEAFIAEHLG